MSDQEFLEMIGVLLEMGSETYAKCKCMVLAEARQSKSEIEINLWETLFRLADRYRPRLLQMQ